ncbi:MAG: hypothetical protein H0W87_01285 [Actinobacteria bacterium]|nr:hypothetical protein [Actinomycetota bacterium]
MRLRPVTQTLVLYAVAAAGYITIGVFFTDFMFSIVVAIGYLVLAVWLVPAGLRRLL